MTHVCSESPPEGLWDLRGPAAWLVRFYSGFAEFHSVSRSLMKLS
jgi:hypothetical protein